MELIRNVNDIKEIYYKNKGKDEILTLITEAQNVEVDDIVFISNNNTDKLDNIECFYSILKINHHSESNFTIEYTNLDIFTFNSTVFNKFLLFKNVKNNVYNYSFYKKIPLITIKPDE